LTGTEAGATAGMAGAAGTAPPATGIDDEDRPTRGGAHIRPDDAGTDEPDADGGDEG
jgi:hypothetical protein